MSKYSDPRSALAWLAALFFAAGAQAGTLAGCPLLPANHIWNTPVDKLPVHNRSAAWGDHSSPTAQLHPDFGTVWDGAPNGIPYVVVAGTQPRVPVLFDYDDESDPGPYPIPPDAPIEGGPGSGGDRHILVLERDSCRLYETWSSYRQADGSWQAGSGAVFDLRSNALRPAGWTSADAAGLPILPGLVRYDEVQSGEIAHALRLTLPNTHHAYLWPARHAAGQSDPEQNLPPMGARFRLKTSVDIAGFSAGNQVILRALKKYGAFLADNGSAWYLSGAPDPRWDDDDLARLGRLHGSDFEAVDVSGLQVDPDSGRAAGGRAARSLAPLQLILHE